MDFLIGDNLVVEVDGWEKYEEVPHDVLRKQRVRDDWLAERGYDTVETVNTANETLTFALPRELRPARTAR